MYIINYYRFRKSPCMQNFTFTIRNHKTVAGEVLISQIKKEKQTSIRHLPYRMNMFVARVLYLAQGTYGNGFIIQKTSYDVSTSLPSPEEWVS